MKLLPVQNPSRPVSIMEATHAFVVPGSDSIIDCVHPYTGKSWYAQENLEQIRLRYPGAEIVNFAEWMDRKTAAQNSPVEWLETTRDRYHEMLEVLPPAMMANGGFLVGEPWDHHAGNGQPRFSAFLHRGEQYLESSRPMTRAEFAAAA